jgi:hypothetical protein
MTKEKGIERPKDHFTAQTYLKHFATKSNDVWVYDKETLSVALREPKAICYERGWSDNPYFQEDRLLEEYLKIYENRWNEAVKLFCAGSVTSEEYRFAKEVIAGYVAALTFNTPARIKAGQGSLEHIKKAEIKVLRKNNGLPRPPKGFEHLLENFENKIKVEVDPKFPQAVGASKLYKIAKTLFGSRWLYLRNTTEIPFVTSDNPACLWYPSEMGHAQTYIPLNPQSAILIAYDPNRSQDDLNGDSVADIKPAAIGKFNDLQIKSAENLIISNTKSDEILEKVELYRHWRFRATAIHLPGNLLITKWQPVEMKNDDGAR